MPQKVRELLNALKNAGFVEIGGAGKGSHRKFTHPDYPGAVTISGKTGDDPITLYGELCTVIEDVVSHFNVEGRNLPPAKVRPMSEVA